MMAKGSKANEKTRIHLYENHYNISLPITDALKVELWMFGIPPSFFENHRDRTSENLPLTRKYDLIRTSEANEIWHGQFQYPLAVLTAYLVKVLRTDSDGNYKQIGYLIRLQGILLGGNSGVKSLHLKLMRKLDF